MSKWKVEITKFTIVGAFNFVLTCAIYYFLLRVGNWHYIHALTVAWIIGVVFTYTCNFIWVFKPTQGFQFKGYFKRYIVSNLMTFVLNLAALYLIIYTTHFDPFLMQMVLVPFIISANFLLAKYWSLISELK